MPLNYNYRKYKDIYTLENTGITLLKYSISKVECDSVTLLGTYDLRVGELKTLPISNIDAVYRIRIFDNVQEVFLEDIQQFNNLLQAIIDGAEEALCGCKKCDECDDCNECDTYLNLINQMLAFTYINSPKYNDYIQTITNQIVCNYKQEVICSLTKKMILGDDDTKGIFLQIVANHYLAFYLFDLINSFDVEESIYIKNKYKSAKLLKCIKKLGIDIDDATNIFLEDMRVYFWQIDDLFENITNIIPIFDDTYLNGKSVVDYADFENGKNITYNLIGRIAFAIKETEVQNFIIMDSSLNDITDEFDNHYFGPEKIVLFVSKIPYSHSTMYFKFKSILYND